VVEQPQPSLNFGDSSIRCTPNTVAGTCKKRRDTVNSVGGRVFRPVAWLAGERFFKDSQATRAGEPASLWS